MLALKLKHIIILIFHSRKAYLLNCECSYVLDLLLCLFEGFMHCLHEGSIYMFSEHSCLHAVGTYGDRYTSDVVSQLASSICSIKKRNILSYCFHSELLTTAYGQTHVETLGYVYVGILWMMFIYNFLFKNFQHNHHSFCWPEMMVIELEDRSFLKLNFKCL